MAKREKLYKIGEIMDYSGFSRQTLHNYTLAGLISEARRTKSGHRLYDESVFDSLERIKILQSKDYTLREIKQILEEERRLQKLESEKQLSMEFDTDDDDQGA